MKLRLNGVEAIEFIGESSNIMNVGLSGIEALIHKLFDSLVILVEIDGEITGLFLFLLFHFFIFNFYLFYLFDQMVTIKQSI